MKSMAVNEVINTVMNSKISCNYLKLINIGMLMFHKNSKVNTIIKSIKYIDSIDSIDSTYNIINSNNILISAIKDNILYINILDNSNKKELLKNLLFDINYYYNIKYNNINNNILYKYINII